MVQEWESEGEEEEGEGEEERKEGEDGEEEEHQLEPVQKPPSNKRRSSSSTSLSSPSSLYDQPPSLESDFSSRKRKRARLSSPPPLSPSSLPSSQQTYSLASLLHAAEKEGGMKEGRDEAAGVQYQQQQNQQYVGMDLSDHSSSSPSPLLLRKPNLRCGSTPPSPAPPSPRFVSLSGMSPRRFSHTMLQPNIPQMQHQQAASFFSQQQNATQYQIPMHPQSYGMQAKQHQPQMNMTTNPFYPSSSPFPTPQSQMHPPQHHPHQHSANIPYYSKLHHDPQAFQRTQCTSFYPSLHQLSYQPTGVPLFQPHY
jgi:hypothetical protein